MSNYKHHKLHLFLALYDPFGVDVPLNLDITHSQTPPNHEVVVFALVGLLLDCFLSVQCYCLLIFLQYISLPQCM